jgi:hypothetical protein
MIPYEMLHEVPNKKDKNLKFHPKSHPGFPFLKKKSLWNFKGFYQIKYKGFNFPLVKIKGLKLNIHLHSNALEWKLIRFYSLEIENHRILNFKVFEDCLDFSRAIQTTHH